MLQIDPGGQALDLQKKTTCPLPHNSLKPDLGGVGYLDERFDSNRKQDVGTAALRDPGPTGPMRGLGCDFPRSIKHMLGWNYVGVPRIRA